MSDHSQPNASKTFRQKDVVVENKERVFDGYFHIDRYHLRHRRHDGDISDVMSREIFERGHASAALLYDPDLEKMVFIEQFRPGAYAALNSPWFNEANASPWLLEIVAGIIEDNEQPDEVIKREAVEEANCHVLDMVPICHYLVSPGGTSESTFLYCARIDASEAGGVYGLDEEHEDIRVLCVDTDQAIDWLEEGRLINSMTIIAMQWFVANHAKLKARWS